jgi:phage gpG-like protein
MAAAAADVDLSDLAAAVAGFRQRGGHLQPVMHAIAEGFVAAVNDNFETGGHGAWPGLATSTLKARRGNTAQILKDTGRLAASIQAYATDDYAEAATDVAYAVFHVSKEPRSKIPLRDFLNIPTEQLVDEPAEMILSYIAGGGL